MTTQQGPCKRRGIHRCSHDGQTKYASEGEALEPCSCRKGLWLFHPKDNWDPATEAKVVYVNGLEVIESVEVFEDGDEINLIGSHIRYDGVYIVTRAFLSGGVRGMCPAIDAEHAGGFDPDLPTYRVSGVAC